MKTETLTPDLLYEMDACWRVADDLSVGQIYLYDNPLLREPLTLAHGKPLVVGHWGTVPGRGSAMTQMEQLEMNAHRAQRKAGVKGLIEKYRSIFDWDVPEVDEALSGRLILKAVRQVLDEIESATAEGTPG